MSDERFSLKEWEDLNYCEHCFYDGESQLSDSDVVVLLNDQQATITHLEKVNGKNFAERRLLKQDNLILRNENEQLRQELEKLKLLNESLGLFMNE